MPAADQLLEQGMCPRVCIYGPAKSKKSWWALSAAEAGYRVLMLDSDRSSTIVAQLSPAARKRVYVIECHDSAVDAYAAAFHTYAFKTFNFWINEETRRLSFNPQAGLVNIDMRSFGRDTVVLVDSYSAIVQSIIKQFCLENNIDQSDAKKTEWPGYNFCGMWLNWLLGQIQQFPCPIIMTGHTVQYEKYKKLPGSNGQEKQGPLEWSRRQLKSSSNPHSMGITKHFTDVLYCYVEGRQAYIDTRGNQYEEGGSRAIPPDRYKWEEMSFAKLASLYGLMPPASVEPFVFPEAQAAAPLMATTSAPAKVAGTVNVTGNTGVAPAPAIQPRRSSIVLGGK